MQSQLDERTLPLAIQHDIKALLDYQNSNITPKLDLDLYCELYGSINCSQHGNEISKEVADYLRDKYLGI
ncbi:hypothetical protein [Helicobacter rodentium]|uniref:hypothetical protein n=1 Tax=Helicobacter rodentium TaxID=59617 RepID=UPI0023F10979|nr:hypothetical protein [Helicobacter rodentium]